MTDGGPCCACLTVRYEPEECDGGKMRERWQCTLCGTEFVKRVFLDSAREANRSMTAENRALKRAARYMTLVRDYVNAYEKLAFPDSGRHDP